MVPLLVRPNGEGFQIICGERRYRAAKELGLKELPVVIRKADDITALRMAYDENLKREDLTLLDEATFLQGLIDKALVKNRQALAESMGVSEGRISQKLKILKLSEKIREGFKIHPFLGELHVRSLAKVDDQGLQERLFGSMLRRELSGHQAEHLVEKAMEEKPKKRKRKSKVVGFDDVKVFREKDKYVLHVPMLPAGKLADLLEKVVEALRGKKLELAAVEVPGLSASRGSCGMQSFKQKKKYL
jgi:ParB/RepB/Spo0J family partition protein